MPKPHITDLSGRSDEWDRYQKLTPGIPKRTLQVTLDAPDYERLDRLANELGWSVAQLARRAVTPYVLATPLTNGQVAA